MYKLFGILSLITGLVAYVVSDSCGFSSFYSICLAIVGFLLSNVLIAHFHPALVAGSDLNDGAVIATVPRFFGILVVILLCLFAAFTPEALLAEGPGYSSWIVYVALCLPSLMASIRIFSPLPLSVISFFFPFGIFSWALWTYTIIMLHPDYAASASLYEDVQMIFDGLKHQ